MRQNARPARRTFRAPTRTFAFPAGAPEPSAIRARKGAPDLCCQRDIRCIKPVKQEWPRRVWPLVVAEIANASPGASWALSRSRALRVEQQHTAPTRWVLLSGEVNQQPRHAWSASSLARGPGPRGAFFVAAGCDEAECLRRTSAARINAAQGRLLAGDDEHALRHIAQADRA